MTEIFRTFLDAIFCAEYVKNELYWRKSFSEDKFSSLKLALETINSHKATDDQIIEPIQAPSFLQAQLEKEKKADEDIKIMREKIMQNLNSQ